jgi:glycosyltransferase involved in cell wall biosynthesis
LTQRTGRQSKRSLSVFFPAYNEEDNIGKVTETAVDVLEEMGVDYEVIIVNDGSLGRTAEVAEELARRHAGVRVIHHERN